MTCSLFAKARLTGEMLHKSRGTRHETDGFTVELGIYGLADVDLGGLGGDKAYEPRPLLRITTR